MLLELIPIGLFGFSVAMWIHSACITWREQARPRPRRETLPPRESRPKLDPPRDLAAVFDVRGTDWRWTVVFDSGDPLYFDVVRLTHERFAFERVHRLLLDVNEPNGRIEWRHLPLTVQREIYRALETRNQPGIATRRKKEMN